MCLSLCVSSTAKHNMREPRGTAQRARSVANPNGAAHRRPQPTTADNTNARPSSVSLCACLCVSLCCCGGKEREEAEAEAGCDYCSKNPTIRCGELQIGRLAEVQVRIWAALALPLAPSAHNLTDAVPGRAGTFKFLGLAVCSD